MSDAITTLIAETRERREALHALIGRVRRDHAEWRQAAISLSTRQRLTRAQRLAFQRYVLPRRRDA